MSSMRALRLVLAVVIAVLVLRAAPASSSQAVGALVIDPRTPTTLYVGRGGGGVLKSTDGGTSWSATALIDIITTSLAIDPQTPTTLYAGDYFGTVYKTRTVARAGALPFCLFFLGLCLAVPVVQFGRWRLTR